MSSSCALAPVLISQNPYSSTQTSFPAPKHPELVMGPEGKLVYDVEQSKEAMVMKVRLIFQVARPKVPTDLVLGVLGCGAYRNPPEEVRRFLGRVFWGSEEGAGGGDGEG
jgi:hypothetical protein